MCPKHSGNKLALAFSHQPLLAHPIFVHLLRITASLPKAYHKLDSGLDTL